MTIHQGSAVQLAMRIRNSEGVLIEEVSQDSPLELVLSDPGIVPGLATALMGMKVGDKKQFVITPEEGFGDYDASKKVSVPCDQFEEEPEVGSSVVTEDDDGDEVVFTVLSTDGKNVMLDGNHTLAGMTLHYEVEVVGARTATEDELQHGHIHGSSCMH